VTEKIKHIEYEVEGMDCADCASHLEKHLQKSDFISDVKVNFISGKIAVGFVDDKIYDDQLGREVKAAGYSLKQNDLSLDISSGNSEKVNSESKEAWWKNYGFVISLSAVFLASAFVAKWLALDDFIFIPLILFAVVLGGYRIAKKGINEASNLQLGINFLMTIAVVGAIIIGEYTEAGMVVVLFALAQLLENRSMDKARKSINMLMNQRPKMARVILNASEISIPVEQVQIGQIVAIKPGESIPVDGIVANGSSYIDQSTITGESRSVKVREDDKVFAGTINKKGYIEIEVTAAAEDSTIAKIVSLVAEAQAQKSSKQTFVEDFARYYTPIVIVLAILIAVIPPLFFQAEFLTWFYRALVVLVISCPCALVISTPVTIVSGLTNAMRRGILIKGGKYLENFAQLKALVFDKTGTITEGQPQVEKIILLNNQTEDELLVVAASLEARSEHPLAAAVVEYANDRGVNQKEIKNFHAIEGKGIEGFVDGQHYMIGNHRLFEENNMCDETIHEKLAKIENDRHTAIIIGNQKQLYGIISIGDRVRKNAREAISELKKSGIKKILMLTGDNKYTAEAVAKKIGADDFAAELLPGDKLNELKKLKEKYTEVAMVGDGVNDAPALAAASIGIAMGTGGSDVALETADIALMKDDLTKLPFLKKLSNRTLRIIKQNIFIALALKFVFLALAIPGWATLWMAVFADMGASLIVIFNGMRALKQNI